jgi:hypothetical protein
MKPICYVQKKTILVSLLLVISGSGCRPHTASGPHLDDVAPGDMVTAKKYVTLAEQAIRDALKEDAATARQLGEIREIDIESITASPHGTEGVGSAGPSLASFYISGKLNCAHASIETAIAIGRERWAITEPGVVFIKSNGDKVQAVRAGFVDPELQFAKP